MGGRKQSHEIAISEIKSLLNTMNYGSITLIIQDGVVIQIERNEKIRLK
ncbi:YezD family protein [Siminovitchia fortis]|uniref:DUF2292 domain-containing protein n=1 Tax=Siminovitchia fortis TaxID=254758 RepID=A0A443IWV0_9BACI|nr:YezD family protein [Siminovitchia fortis]RWR12539.1 DUF2292 domain-containing protein [Siminovitchia fortis]WHY81616.1 YezD family protein [Siminovitchia fortis]